MFTFTVTPALNMPAAQSGKVLVTGANGFVGAWIVKAFLDAGYSVRAQVRSESKTTHLRSLFSTFGDKIEFSIVSDMTKVRGFNVMTIATLAHAAPQEGAFDDAMAGVVAVAHNASPTTLLADDPEAFIRPAVDGTLNCLRTAANTPSVKRFIYLSSCATVMDPSATEARVYDETCWNTVDTAEVREKGSGASVLVKYRASKILAEQSAWKFFEDAKAKGPIGWDLVVINPPWIFGPSIQELGPTYESMNASDAFLYKAIVRGEYDASFE